MSILGVVPAAGKGTRWGGYYKEFLPCYDNAWLIDRTITNMILGGANEVLVVTNTEKISAHSVHLQEKFDTELLFALQSGKRDIYSAVETSLHHARDTNLFAMPDTYIQQDVFARDFKLDFYLGTFTTLTPERFGVLHEGKILDKNLDLPQDRAYEAWGVIVWSKDVAEYWLASKVKSLPDAINRAMNVFEWDTFHLDYYYDISTWEEYKKFMCE